MQSYRSSIRCVFEHRCVVIRVGDVDMDHGRVGPAAGVGGGDREHVASLLLEVQRLRHCYQATAVLRRDGETAPGVATGDFIV